jgi:tripartite ATP-independent transporter DctP family solute receptor
MSDAEAPGHATTRRRVLAGAMALPLVAVRTRPARAAEFDFKFATGQSPGNPINTRLQEAIDRIKAATGGRLALTLFPNNQLGSDTDQISQLRAGGIDFLNVAGSVLSTLVPATALVNVGFAFTSYDQVWKGVDGALGDYIKGQVDKAGIVLVAPLGDNGFRQITTGDTAIRGPADLRGFHIRVPVSPIFTSLFQALGAAPTSINFNEVYTALQTRLVGGEENGLVTIDTAKLYEVQKYCSETDHIWDSFCVLANRRALGSLPADMQELVRRELRQAVLDQRADEARLDAGLKSTLEGKGMTFIPVDKAAFRAAVAKTSFYPDWKAKFGDEAWAALQTVSGQLT